MDALKHEPCFAQVAEQTNAVRQGPIARVLAALGCFSLENAEQSPNRH